MNRFPSGGLVDRSRSVSFRFNGLAYEAYRGDTLASALLANGVKLVARSFKYHRPRGIISAGVDEPNAIVDIVSAGMRLPNLRATEVEVSDGLCAHSVNCWPSVSFDLGAVNGMFARFLAAGFYYKTFMLPHWHAYEWVIRRAAGLGRLSTSWRTPRADHRFAHCDVLVVGAGPAGLAAAHAAASGGARVMLVEQDTMLGGSALWNKTSIDGQSASEWARIMIAALSRSSNVQILTRTTASGYFDHNELMLIERLAGEGRLAFRVWQVRAKQVILATGALERPLVFAGNDRPGIMLASAVAQYTERYAVRLGTKAVIFTNNDTAYGTAETLKRHGVAVEAIIDTRPPEGPRRSSDFHCITGEIIGTFGGHALKAARVRRTDGSEATIACDVIAMSGGWSPTLHLFAQSGGRANYDASTAAFVPGDSVQAERSVGAANGYFSVADTLKQACKAGREAAGLCGYKTDALWIPSTESLPAYSIDGHSTHAKDDPKAFVDFQNDVTTRDINLAARENFASVEHMKRYTTLGMATDQGKTSNVNAIALLGAATSRTPEAVGVTRYRPPFTPVPVGAYAGRRRGHLYRPQRRTPIYEWHAAHGATFEEFGEWSRPAHYLRTGETRDDAMRREVLAVRRHVGLFDNSPLGKIEVSGPDAARFLDFIYANTMSTLKPGRLRYGIMLNEQGVILDDGVVGRLGEEKFWVGTTSGGAARIVALLEEWLQCEFLDYRVVVAPVTADWSVPTITGASARDVLTKLEPNFDISNEAFPHMSFRDGAIGGVPARLFRMSFTGELTYEIYVPSDRGAELWSRLINAGAPFDVEAVGIDAWLALRTEKGYLHVGSDTDATTTPDDIGWGHIHKRSGDFVGRRSLLRPANRREDRHQLVGVETLDPVIVPAVGEHLRTSVSAIDGYVTSSCFSHTLGRSVALAMLKGGRRRMGEECTLAISGARVRVGNRVAYDVAGARLHA